VDADAVAETVQGNYMSFLPLLPEVPGGGRHDWEAQAPLPVQQAWRCPAPWRHAADVSVGFHSYMPDSWCAYCRIVRSS